MIVVMGVSEIEKYIYPGKGGYTGYNGYTHYDNYVFSIFPPPYPLGGWTDREGIPGWQIREVDSGSGCPSLGPVIQPAVKGIFQGLCLI